MSPLDFGLKYPPTPEHAASLAEVIVPVALDASGATLDYTPESLAEVDRILGGFHSDRVQIDRVLSTLFCFGCYVGEVFVRNIAGAKWCLTSETAMAGASNWPIIVQTGLEDFVNPIGKVFKRVENGPDDDLPYFYTVFGKQKT